MTRSSGGALDLGVIGMPDQVLLKAGPLNADDSLRIEQSRRMTLEILRSACGEPEVLQIVEHVPAWYDGSRGGCSAIGRKIPWRAHDTRRRGIRLDDHRSDLPPGVVRGTGDAGAVR